jgi:flavin-binding protein dodecin
LAKNAFRSKLEEELTMAVVKVLEVIAESEKGWEEAAQEAVQEASKTVRSIKHVYIENQQGIVEDGKIVKFRVNAKLSFLVE